MASTVEQYSATPKNAYQGAVSHYMSPGRRDPVKRLWEEPVTLGFLSTALDYLGPLETTRVLDVGSGAGEGVKLLLSLEETGPWHSQRDRYRYCGLDLDGELLNAARTIHARRPEVSFLQGDMRADLPDDPFDLYFSSGVPFSHLTPAELGSVLKDIFSSVRKNRTKSVVVIDVLGRYSIEWAGLWDVPRRGYRMSFFNTSESASDVPMTFWESHGLKKVIDKAATAAGQKYEEMSMHDRSIMVGRHTQTREYNANIPPYRLLVNRLERGDEDVRPEDLHFPALPTNAPTKVLNFFDSMEEQWQMMLRTDLGHLAPDIRGPMLARGLRELEHRMEPGLGVGHSLTAIVHIDATQDNSSA